MTTFVLTQGEIYLLPFTENPCVLSNAFDFKLGQFQIILVEVLLSGFFNIIKDHHPLFLIFTVTSQFSLSSCTEFYLSKKPKAQKL